jgi:RNA polymerase primary sigma factor
MKDPKKFLMDDRMYVKYYRELQKIPVMNTKRELQIRALFLGGTLTEAEQEKLKGEMIEGHLRFVVKESMKYAGHGVSISDLISEGNLYLMEAMKTYSWSSGNKFISYAVWWVKKGLLETIYNNALTIKMPMRVVQKLHRQLKRLMADGTELDGDVVALPTTTTLHRPVKGQEKIELIDVLEDQEVAAPDAQLIQDDSILNALRRLKPKERKIINMAFGLDGETELEPAAIADRMDMSTYGVQLLIKRAVEKMAGRV